MKSSYNPKTNIMRRVLSRMQIIKQSLTYLHLPSKDKLKDTVFFIIDPRYQQAGLADRLKAIVNTYYIAKNNNLAFKLYFKHPFDIERYLQPNNVNWRCSLDDLDCSIWASKLLEYRAQYPLPVLHKGCQYHYYWYQGNDAIRLYYAKTNFETPDECWHDEFRNCFNELFNQTLLLESIVASTGLVERSYISVHFRFVNLLGNFEGNTRKFPTLDKEAQERLIEKCLDCLKTISEDNQGLPIYVFSDSSKFLQKCTQRGYNKISGDSISNIASSSSVEAEDKTMLDFFTIGRSKKVYSVVLSGMYGGVFSQYAAMIGGAVFERIEG